MAAGSHRLRSRAQVRTRHRSRLGRAGAGRARGVRAGAGGARPRDRTRPGGRRAGIPARARQAGQPASRRPADRLRRRLRNAGRRHRRRARARRCAVAGRGAAPGRRAAALRSAMQEPGARDQKPGDQDAPRVPCRSAGERPAAAARLRDHAAQGHVCGAGVGDGRVVRRAREGVRSAVPAAPGPRDSGGDAAGDPGPGWRRDDSAVPARGAWPAARPALRHVRLQRRARNRGRSPEPGAPGGRPREGGHAGGGGRDRRAAVGRLDERAAGRQPRRRAGRLAVARTAGATVPGTRLLPGLGPAPGAARQPLRGHIRVLPGRHGGRLRPAAGERRSLRIGPGGTSHGPRPLRLPVPRPRHRLLPGSAMTGSVASAPGDIDLIIRANRAVTPAGVIPGEVGVRKGVIAYAAEFDAGTAAPREQRSAGSHGTAGPVIPPNQVLDSPEYVTLPDDEVLMPGLVDTHVHVNEPGRTTWEGFATATAAAAAGGVTTIIDMPLNSIPPTTDVAALAAKRQAAAGQCAVDVGFWGGAIPGNAEDRAGLHEAGVFGFKCFLIDSGVPEFPPLGDDGLAAAMSQVAGLGSLLIVHAEDAGVIAAAPPASGSGYGGFLRSRPPAAEVSAIIRVIRLAAATGPRVHVLHLSSADPVPLLTAARDYGAQITAETCPHYLTLAAEQVGAGQTEFKCCPPIRETANRERFWTALESGAIDCVVSDHSPCPPELKDPANGDFGVAWGGISSVQLGLPVIWTHARERGFSLADVVRWMSASPARLAGLATKGAIAQGHDADLVAFAPDEDFVVVPDRLLTRHKLTPYAGAELTGVVRRTWLRGVPVTPSRADARPAGRLLVPSSPPSATKMNP